MPKWTQAGDLDTSNLPFLGGAGTQAYRVSNAVNTYYPGTVLVLSAVDSQILPDFQTVQASPATANTAPIAGVVADSWGGFDNAGIFATSYTSVSTQLNVRGTQFVQAKIKGINYVFINAANGANVLNGTALCTSQNTIGYAQGISSTAAAPNIVIGAVNMPTTSGNWGGTITAAALVQGSGTLTIAGSAWQVGDVITANFQVPFTDLQPGTIQYNSVSITLNATSSASATAAATALTTALNANPYFAANTTFGQTVQGVLPYYVATSSAGVVTIKTNAIGNPFLVTGGSTNTSGLAIEQWRFQPSASGQLANNLNIYGAYVQAAGSSGTISPTTATALSSGAGFLGRLPATIYGQY